MFRKDYVQIQNQTRKIMNDVQTKADTCGLIYVLCMWESPVNRGKVEKRVGYFEDIGEADHMKDYLADIYSKYDYPFYITTSYGDVEDGALFDTVCW